MQTDTTTRLLLAGILVCLVALVVQNLGDDPPLPPSAPTPVVAAPAPAPPPAEPRYRNQRGRQLDAADIVSLSRTVGNPALPLDMRVWAALQLERVRHPEVERVLIAALEDPDGELATAALQALAGNPDPRVRAAAERGLGHEDESVQGVARYVLDSLE